VWYRFGLSYLLPIVGWFLILLFDHCRRWVIDARVISSTQAELVPSVGVVGLEPGAYARKALMVRGYSHEATRPPQTGAIVLEARSFLRASLSIVVSAKKWGRRFLKYFSG